MSIVWSSTTCLMTEEVSIPHNWCICMIISSAPPIFFKRSAVSNIAKAYRLPQCGFLRDTSLSNVPQPQITRLLELEQSCLCMVMEVSVLSSSRTYRSQPSASLLARLEEFLRNKHVILRPELEGG